MPLVVVGLNHNTAPVDIRERFAFGPDHQQTAVRAVAKLPGVREAALLSTCNRTEIYAETDSGDGAAIIDWMHGWHQLTPATHKECFYQEHDQQAVRHLLFVSAGLDSLVLGEPQIGGQIKQTWEQARAAGTAGAILDRWFQRAFHAVKRVRAETAIGRDPVTVPFAAVTLARQIFDDLPQRRALLVGAGEMMNLCASYLRGQGLTGITIANRSLQRATALAAEHRARALTLDDLPLALSEADLVISSTASKAPLITLAMARTAIQQRRHTPMLLVDIAVPRDIEPSVAELEDIFLYTIDDLQEVIRNSMGRRRQAATEAEKIVDEETRHFMTWLEERRAADAVSEYRHQAVTTRDVTLDEALRQLAAGHDPETVIRQLSHRLTNRLIHQPSRGLRHLASSGRHDIVKILSAILTDQDQPKD